MKRVYGMIMLVGMFFSSCTKEAVEPMYAREKPHAALQEEGLLRPRIPWRPDTILRPVWPNPRLPRLPLIPTTPPSRCINSYEDFIGVFGKDRIMAKAVILENDVELPVSADLPAIIYTAVPEVQGSSLFRSQLQVEWRPDASTYFSGFSMDVWTLGCVHLDKAVGPFTNILKGGVEVLINTGFIWGASPYQHLRIKYIVTD